MNWLPRRARLRWLLNELGKPQYAGGVHHLMKSFVTDYVRDTGAPMEEREHGGVHCHQLRRELTELANIGALEKERLTIRPNSPGTPRWVYSYRLAPDAHAIVAGMIEERERAAS